MRTESINPRRIKRATLAGAISVLATLGFTAAAAPAWATGSARPATSQAIPVPPAGWHPKMITRPGLVPQTRTWTETLSPAACSALNHQHPGAAPDCKLHDSVTGEKGMPLPSGTRFTASNGADATASSAPYYQFLFTFNQCGPTCNAYKISFEINGVFNGYHVYQWNIWVTPSSNGPQAKWTWKGYKDNGGAAVSNWPSPAMQFGENSEIDTYLPSGAQADLETWQRVWVDVYGSWFDHTQGS
jgi:hypothetical protein